MYPTTKSILFSLTLAVCVAGCGKFRGLLSPPSATIDPALSVFAMTRPTTGDVVLPAATFAVQYAATLGNIVNHGEVALYYATAGLTCDEASLSGWTALTSGLNATATGYNWATTGLPVGSYSVCAVFTDDTGHTLYSASPAPLRIDAEPTIALTTPPFTNPQAALNSTYAIGFTAVDPDDDAQVSLYYKTGATNCTDGTLTGWTQIVSGLSENSVSSYNWNTTGIATGDYLICAKITDGIAPAAYAISAGHVHLNQPPTISFTNISGVYALAGTTKNVTFTVADPDDNATFDLYLQTASSGSDCATGGISLVTGLHKNTDTSWNYPIPAAQNSGTYYLCATLNDGINPAVSTYSASFVIYHDCTWTGGSTQWNDSSNWTGCSSMVPQSVDLVLVPAAPVGPNQPAITSSTTISGFFSGSGGGIITIAAGTSLNIPSARSTSSSIGFQGDTPTCNNCLLSFGSYQFVYLGGGMTLTLLPGIYVGGLHTLGFGDGNAGANLVASGGATPAEWPTIGFGAQVRFDGLSGSRSTVNINGLHLEGFASVPLFFNDYYTIDGLDRVSFDSAYGPQTLYFADMIRLSNCAHAQINDTSWSSLAFNDITYGSGHNINIDSCSGVGPINVSGSGIGYGPTLAADANANLVWTNGNTFTCTWTGAIGTSWIDPGNWSGCANGRAGFPDVNDWVIIPSAPSNQPQLPSTEGVLGMATGAGGGTISIPGGRSLFLFNGAVRSDVAVACSTPASSSNVYVNQDLTVTQNAKLTLNSMIVLSTGGSNPIKLGDGTTAGSLATGVADSIRNYWPVINLNASQTQGILVQGGGGQRSKLQLDGLNVSAAVATSGTGMWTWASDFQIDQFDHVGMQFSAFPTVNYLTINTCVGSAVNALTWHEIDFLTPINLGAAHNVDITNCAALGTGAITITRPTYSPYASRAGYAIFAHDPDSVLQFQTPGVTPGTASFLSTDTTHLGTWIGTYGSSGYYLPGFVQSLPAGLNWTSNGSVYTWTASTTDLNGTQLPPTGTTRGSGTLYNPGQFYADIVAPTSTKLTLYFIDWDHSGRAQTIELIDFNTGTILDTRSLPSFNTGVYFSWRIQGAVTVRVIQTGGNNALINAAFFDP